MADLKPSARAPHPDPATGAHADSTPAPPDLSRIAARGSIWMAAQAGINKFATAATMYLVALRLDADDLGTGQFALSIAAVAAVFPPLVMCDVLVANQSRLPHCLAPGRRIARRVGLATAGLLLSIACLIPLAGLFPKFPGSTLGVLVLLLAFRVLANSDIAPSLALLRSSLRYRSIASIDGGVQLAANAVTLAVAFSGGGAAAIVLPHLFSSASRAILYRWLLRRDRIEPAETASDRIEVRDESRRLFAQFRTASIAQYAHVAVGALPAFIIGLVSSEQETGLYAFAYMLATQSTVIVAYQLGVVLQPIFGRLSDEPTRQCHAYLRVLRTISVVSVPVSLLQAALAAPLFALFFSPKWDEALPTFQVLSVLQAFHFALAPTLSLLKSQARFGTTLRWQAMQAGVSACVLLPVAHRFGATGAAIADTAIWSVSLAIGMTLACRASGLRLAGAFGVSLRPWIAAAPIAASTYLGAEALGRFGTAGHLAAILALGPIALAACLGMQYFTDRGPLVDLAARIPGLRRMTPADRGA